MQSKWNIILVVGVMIFGSLAHAGTGVASGANSNREAYIEQIKNEILSKNGNNRPGVNDSQGQNANNMGNIDNLSSWCSKVSTVLKRESKRAQLQIQYERFESAVQIMKDALIAVSQTLNMDPSTSPITKRLVDRGLVLTQAIEQSLCKNNCESGIRNVNTLAFFLYEYTQQIIRTEAELDRPWYLPYQYRYNRCNDNCPSAFNYNEFQQVYLRFAREQLSFINNHFVDTVIIDGRYEVRPVGNPSAYLKSGELTAAFVAEDLANTLYAYQNACAIQNLNSLSEVLFSFNENGDRSVYPNTRWAVQSTYDEINAIADSLAAQSYPGCGDYRRRY